MGMLKQASLHYGCENMCMSPWPRTFGMKYVVEQAARQPVTWKAAVGVGGEQRGWCGRNV